MSCVTWQTPRVPVSVISHQSAVISPEWSELQFQQSRQSSPPDVSTDCSTVPFTHPRSSSQWEKDHSAFRIRKTDNEQLTINIFSLRTRRLSGEMWGDGRPSVFFRRYLLFVCFSCPPKTPPKTPPKAPPKADCALVVNPFKVED